MQSPPTENPTGDRPPIHERIAAMVITRPERSCLLTINGGSSSLKFALFPQTSEDPARPLLKGRLERIGLAGARAVVEPTAGEEPQTAEVDARTSVRRRPG
jgi:hypothetical protein